MAKRCLIVTYYFPPQGGGGVQRITKLIKYLSRDNWQFTVMACVNAKSNMPQDLSLLREIPEQVKIIDVPNPATSGKISLFGKISVLFKSTFLVRWVNSFFNLPDRFKVWTKPVGEKILETMQSDNFDAILISSPPYSLVQLAAWLTNKVTIPVIIDMRDPWTTHPLKIHPTRWHFNKDRMMETEAIKQIKYGVSVTKSLINFYEQNIAGFQKNNWCFIPNGFDKEDFNEIKPQKLDAGKFHIAYSGTFYSHLNPPELIFKAIMMMQTDLKTKICFHHVGTSMIPAKKIAARYGLAKNFKEWGYKDHKDCLNILAGMDALCIILDSADKNAANTIGGKVYEYLKLKKPILALVPENGEAAQLISESNSGIIIDPYKSAEICRLLTEWVEKKPKFTFDADSSRFERSGQAKMYGNFLENIILGKHLNQTFAE